MRKFYIPMLIIISLIIAILNLSNIPVAIGIEPLIPVYHYENSEGKDILEVQAKGRVVDYNEPGLKRKFKKNYLKFWNWYKYMSHPRWRLEYYK